MKKVKFLMIGAGVSNLTFANYISDKDYLILEKENEVGGYCRTIKRNGFIWDYAGHFFHFASPKIKSFFQQKISSDKLLSKEKKTYIYYKGQLLDFPFQKNIHQLSKDEFIDCLYDLYNKSEKEKYDSFKDMLLGKFGNSISNKFLIPYNEKLYACDLDSLDVDAMGRFFPYADVEEIIMNFKNSNNTSYNSTFLYPKEGAKVFVDALLEDIDYSKIQLKTKAIEIDRENRILKTSNGDLINYKFLINSSPFNQLLSILKPFNYEFNESILSFNKVLVFNLGFNKKKINNIHWGYVPESKFNFYRIGFYDNILEQDRTSMYVEIGFSSNASIDVDLELKSTLKGLNELGVIDSTFELIDYEPIIMNPAYVHVSKEGTALKEKIKGTLEINGIYSIGRYGNWKYCSIEDSMIDALTLCDKFNLLN